MQIVIGAAIFAVGVLFGMWATCVGAEIQKKQTGHKFQDAFLKAMDKANGREDH